MTIDEKRLAEIRGCVERDEELVVPIGYARDLLAMLDTTRENMRAIIAAAYPTQPDAPPTVRELCEHIGALHDAVESAEKRAEDAECKLASLTRLAQRAVAWAEQDDPEVWVACERLGEALADVAPVAACHRRAEDAERRCDEWKRDCWQQATTIGRVVSMLGFEPGTWNSVDLPRSVADLRTRAEDAERKLAALHAEVGGEGFARAAWHGTVGVAMADALERVRAAWSDAAPVAERHDRKVRAKELRRAASICDEHTFGGEVDCSIADTLRKEADRIERGEIPST